MSCHPPRLREGDLARTDVAAHLGCGWDRVRRAAPRWERAELFLELVGDPAGLVAELLGDVGEHPVPTLAHLRIVDVELRSAVTDQPKLAGPHGHVTRRTLRQESTVRALL